MSKEKLKTRYKFIHFYEALSVHTKKYSWICHNNKNGSALGAVEFYRLWNQYIIEFNNDCVFNSQCLKDIADFLEQLNRRAK